jgi:hypothetical protein
MGLKAKYSFIAFIAGCIILASASQYVWKWNEQNNKWLITFDISGYYMYLPFLFYDDLGKQHNRQYIIDNYKPCGDAMESYLYQSTGNYINKYTSGMAIMYLPGFIAGHIYAKLGNYPVDGFSYPYQFAMAMYSLLVVFLGLWLIRKVLLVYFDDLPVAISLFTLCFATNYLSYAGVVNMFSHTYLFTLYAAIIFITTKWYNSPAYKKTALLGLLCGLATLTRPTEIICVIIPLFWAVYNWHTLQARVNYLINHYKHIALFIICAVLIGSTQIIYWKYYTGHLFYWSYGTDEKLNLLRVHIAQCLFSYKKGWFVYTPVMILSILGFIPLYLHQKKIFWPITVFVFLCLWITFSWSTWWYGGSFSMRAVIQYYALLIFPLTAFFSWAAKSKIALGLTTAFIIFCVWLNFVMTYQVSVSFIGESDNMNKAYFWKIFGKLHADRKERKLLDSAEEIPTSIESKLYPIYTSDTANNTLSSLDTLFNDEFVLINNNISNFIEARFSIQNKPKGWYRASMDVYVNHYVGSLYGHPSVYIGLLDKQGQKLKRNSYYLSRVADPGQWQHICIDIDATNNDGAMLLNAGCYTNGSAEVMMKNLKVEFVAN